MSNKVRVLAKGSVLRIVEFFAIALVTLAMTPFIIRSLGDNMYGLWVFVGSFLGYYGLMDFGLNSAVQRFLSKAIGLKDDIEANKIINTSLHIFTVLGLLALLFSILLAYFMPVFIKNISEILVFRSIVIILGVNFAIGFPMRVFFGIMTANLRYELSTIIELFKLVARTILIIIYLKTGYGIIALALITLFVDLTGYAVRYVMIKKLYRSVIFSKRFFDIKKIRSLFGYSVYTFISQVADQLRFNINNLIITAFIGLSAVTLYSIAARLVRYFIDLVSAAIGILTPVFSQYEAKGDYKSIKEKFIFTTKISSYLSIMIGGIIIIFGRAFIQRWVGREYLSAYPILVILTIPIVIALMQAPSLQLLYGISKHKFFAISNSIEGIVNLILSLILVKKFGLMGVALGTAIPMVIIKLFIQPVYTCKIIKLDIRRYYLNILAPTIFNSIVVFVVFWFVFKNFILPDYLNLLTMVLIVIAVFVISMFFFGFKYFERNYLKKIIFNLE